MLFALSFKRSACYYTRIGYNTTLFSLVKVTLDIGGVKLDKLQN